MDVILCVVQSPVKGSLQKVVLQKCSTAFYFGRETREEQRRDFFHVLKARNFPDRHEHVETSQFAGADAVLASP